MQTNTTLQKAKYGSADAIQALMTPQMSQKGIKVECIRKKTTLFINLTSDRNIPQETAVLHIKAGMKKLNPEGTKHIIVSAYRTGLSRSIWKEDINKAKVEASKSFFEKHWLHFLIGFFVLLGLRTCFAVQMDIWEAGAQSREDLRQLERDSETIKRLRREAQKRQRNR